MKKRGRKSMFNVKAGRVFEALRNRSTAGPPSWLELMMDYKLSVSSLARIMRKLETEGKIMRMPGRGTIRNEYIITEVKHEPRQTLDRGHNGKPDA